MLDGTVVAAGNGNQARACRRDVERAGVLDGDDLVALGVLQVLIRHGVRVPGDMALIGFDDIEFAAAAAIPLTSVRQPRQLMGRTAADLLLEEASGDPAHEHRRVVFEPELVVRASTIGNRG